MAMALWSGPARATRRKRPLAGETSVDWEAIRRRREAELPGGPNGMPLVSGNAADSSGTLPLPR